MAKFETSCREFRDSLVRNKFEISVRAFDFASKIHTGLRKDGRTPEFVHPFLVGSNLYNIRKMLFDPDGTVANGLCHDVREDNPEVTYQKMVDVLGADVAHSTEKMNKYDCHRRPKPLSVYWYEISEDVRCSIVKPADKYNNLETNYRVFSPEKQIKKLREIAEYTLPAMRRSKVCFPDQLEAYLLYQYLLKHDIVIFCDKLGIDPMVLSDSERIFTPYAR